MMKRIIWAIQCVHEDLSLGLSLHATLADADAEADQCVRKAWDARGWPYYPGWKHALVRLQDEGEVINIDVTHHTVDVSQCEAP